uniref:Uncharacterized protein n=1 Tax=Manihot esculenta TaxID=3983 RepID=A0A2C9UME5_MANES
MLLSLHLRCCCSRFAGIVVLLSLCLHRGRSLSLIIVALSLPAISHVARSLPPSLSLSPFLLFVFP